MKAGLLSVAFAVMLAATTIAVARPRSPLATMSVVLPAEFHQYDRLPLKLTFKFSTDEERTISTDAIEFILLGEDGRQVSIDPFNLADSSEKSVLKGKEPTFEPAIRFDPYHTEIVVGKKYQLVCTWKFSGGTLAGSAWFTLIK